MSSVHKFSSDELALLAAIHANPRDDLPRLVYADWLDENGQPEYAQFIRLSVVHHGTLSNNLDLLSVWERLYQAHGRWWASPKPKPLNGNQYRRGLPMPYLFSREVEAARVELLLQNMSPRIRLRIDLRDDDRLFEWCANPIMGRVSMIQFGSGHPNGPTQITPQGVERLAAMPAIERIELVDLGSNLSDETKAASRKYLEPRVPVGLW